MAVLFVPIAIRFAGAPAGGSGTVVQWTYTVPAGKRAVATHFYLQVNGNALAANTIATDIITTLAPAGAVELFAIRDRSGLPANFTKELFTQVDMQGGDTLQGRSINTGAAAVTVAIVAIIREYL